MIPVKKPDWWDQWTYFDEDSRETKLKKDAPAKVKREWKALQRKGGYSD